MALGIFCIQLDSFALNLVLPELVSEFGVVDGQWAISAYLLSVGTLMLSAGRLGDLRGRRRLLRVGLAAFGSGSLLCAVAPTFSFLVLARAVQGVGGALIMPVGLSLLTNTFPAERRGRAAGLAIGLGGFGTALGPFVGGALADVVSWRAIFWLNVPIVLLALLSPTSADEIAERERRVDVGGLAWSTGALAFLAVYIGHVGDWGWSANFLLLGGIGCGIVFVRWERRTPLPLVDLTLFANRRFVLLTCSGAVANLATVVFLYVVPFALRAEWGMGPTLAGLVFLVPSGLMAVAGPVAGRVRPERAIAVMAGALFASSAALGVSANVDMLIIHILGLAVCGASLGLANALTLVGTQAAVEPARAGEASGVTKTVITLAAGLGAAVVTPDGIALTTVGLGALVTAGLLVFARAAV